jgi:hypothetical protein
MSGAGGTRVLLAHPPDQRYISMSSNAHAETCRCALHQQQALARARHQAYRQLALAILGPDAPREDVALARALADHAGLSQQPPARLAPVSPFGPRRRAA